MAGVRDVIGSNPRWTPHTQTSGQSRYTVPGTCAALPVPSISPPDPFFVLAKVLTISVNSLQEVVVAFDVAVAGEIYPTLVRSAIGLVILTASRWRLTGNECVRSTRSPDDKGKLDQECKRIGTVASTEGTLEAAHSTGKKRSVLQTQLQ